MAEYINKNKLVRELECGIRAGNYEKGFENYMHINDIDDCVDTVKYFDVENVIPIPEGTTNGDMIMAMFNCMVIEISNGKVYVEHIYFPFDEEWWNAPYKRESEK